MDEAAKLNADSKRNGGNGLAFSPDSRRLAATGYYGDVLVIELASRSVFRFSAVPAEWEGRVGVGADRRLGAHPIAFRDEGRELLIGCMDGMIRSFDARTGEVKAEFGTRGSAIEQLVLDSGRSRMAVTRWNEKGVEVLDLKTGNRVGRIEAEPRQMSSIALTAEGREIVMAGYDRAVRRYDVAGGRCVGTLSEAWPSAVYVVGELILVASCPPTGAGTLITWDRERSVSTPLPAPCVQSALSPDGRELAIGRPHSTQEPIRFVELR